MTDDAPAAPAAPVVYAGDYDWAFTSAVFDGDNMRVVMTGTRRPRPLPIEFTIPLTREDPDDPTAP